MFWCIDLGQQVAGADAESFGEFGEVHDTYVAFATFDTADVVAVQAGLEAQVLLGPTPFFPKPPQLLAHLAFDVCRPHGWALALPGAGAFAAHGGGVIVDPFEDQPIHHACVPRCGEQAWRCFVKEHRHVLNRVQREHSRPHYHTDRSRSQRPHPLTNEFLAGQTPKGRRNTAAFAAAYNLLGNGLPLCEVERLIVRGAHGCELPEREAHSAVQSALRAVERSP